MIIKVTAPGGTKLNIDKILKSRKEIRYVAFYDNEKLETVTKSSSANASSSETDKYEELIVNPTVLKITKQRGDIDCGGLRYVLIRYGNFFQYVREMGKGHISICLDENANINEIVAEFEEKILNGEWAF